MRLLPLAALASVILFAACTPGPNDRVTMDGQNLGAVVWKDAPVETGLISFSGPNPVKKRESAQLTNELLERVTLQNGVVIYYTKLRGDVTFNDPDGEKRALLLQNSNAFFAGQGVKVSDADIKKADYFSYVALPSDKGACFIAKGVFGEKMGAFGGRITSVGDREMSTGVCFNSPATAASVEKAMLDLLGRAHFGQ